MYFEKIVTFYEPILVICLGYNTCLMCPGFGLLQSDLFLLKFVQPHEFNLLHIHLFWIETALCCPAPADLLMVSALSLWPFCLRCNSKPLSHVFLSPCLCPASFFAALKVNSSFVSSAVLGHLSLCLCWPLIPLYVPSHLGFATIHWSTGEKIPMVCVYVCVCCLVVLATCCPSPWRPLWSWWTMALYPGTHSLWPSLRRSA